MNLKRHFVTGLAVACLVLGAAIAQNITKSVQLSQDPLGPIGYDTASNTYFPGHINGSGTAPSTLLGCGTSPVVVGSDLAGNVTEGTGTVSGCNMQFRTAFNASPYCVASATSTAAPVGTTATAGGVTFTHNATTVSLTYNYICIGKT